MRFDNLGAGMARTDGYGMTEVRSVEAVWVDKWLGAWELGYTWMIEIPVGRYLEEM